MRRRLFNFLAGSSLLLCVLFVCLGVQSHWRQITIRSPMSHAHHVQFYSNRGLIFVWMPREPWFDKFEIETVSHAFAWWDMEGNSIWRKMGLGYESDVAGRVLVVPYWLLVIVFGFLPAVWLWRWWMLDEKLGLCPRCGYDLRATPDRCPECGYQKKKPAAPAA
jgi:hypothetical protein